MEQRIIFYRGGGSRNPPRKILILLGLLGLPVIFGLSAYFWLTFKKHDKKWKSRAASQRVKKGIPPGLVNLGNTCFINCLLQAFSAVKNFCKWIDDLEDDEDKILLSSLKYMLKVLNNKKSADQDIFSASDVIDSLSAHGWIGTTQQQDVHEFFQVVSSTLEDELTSDACDEHGMFFEDVCSKRLNGVINRACRDLSAKRPIPTSPFKGALANRMVCLSCGYQSVRFDPFETISLQIPRFSSLTGSSLDICLAEFVKKEFVDDVNCPGCTKSRGSFMPVKSRFSKQLTFAKLPKCFCFHIQRSHFLSNGTSYKNNQFVRFSDIIDISSCRYSTSLGTTSKINLNSDNRSCGREEQPPLHDRSGNFPRNRGSSNLAFSSSSYRLQSVIVHIGEVHMGHFVTYRRATNTQDDWVYSSDECTKLVSKRSVLSSNAYLLFYERTDQHVSH